MPMSATRKRLKKRLKWIFQVEGINVVMFFSVLLFLNAQYDSSELIFLSYGLLFMCYILFQGTYYWYVKLSRINNEQVEQSKVLARFRTFKSHNILGICLIPFVLLAQWYLSGKQLDQGNKFYWALFVNAFAVLEYINYYHTQLMYDNRYDFRYLFKHRQFKTASLHKDLKENQI